MNPLKQVWVFLCCDRALSKFALHQHIPEFQHQVLIEIQAVHISGDKGVRFHVQHLSAVCPK